ncbi:MAG: CPBP family intramembrane metalloprotease [SAR324 cluster bacterium]|nr:CPBP family intramembrane metalloprotease [SAR324 cluster bacterium]
MKQYFQVSHSAFYSVVTALPLLIGYEIMLASTSNPYWHVRNAVDIWMRHVLQSFDVSTRQATFVMIGVLFAAIPFIHKKETPLRFKYAGWMILEAIIYSLCLNLIIQSVLKPVFLTKMIPLSNSIQSIALSLGAGLFEEFFFRVILLNVLYFGLLFLLKKPLLSGIIAILLASFLFSLSHYFGNMADSFNLYSFLFRWFAGLLFTLLYFLRGFGITAYTHAFYDIRILLLA